MTRQRPRRRPRAPRVEVAEAEHGTRARYTSSRWHCRCPECRAANAAYEAERIGRPRRSEPAVEVAPKRKTRRRRPGRARRGLESTISTWRDAGQVEPADDAWLALARITADTLDQAADDPDESRFTIGALASRHRDTLTTLDDHRRQHETDGPSLMELLASMDEPDDEPSF